LHTARRQLFHQQHLMGIFARQSIRRQDVQTIQQAERGMISQPFQLRPNHRRATHPGIDKMHALSDLRPIDGNSLG
jgi:hypothetical protein